ncbi:cation transporter [Candidatus Nitromaritima sp. SCGC AAA799-C22]|nr:cation transporter [Candidatus Nitromaritima sp. SCGC AAA799-C22]
MIEKIIEICSRKRFLVLVFVFLLSGWGYLTLKKTPLDAIPDLGDVQVILFTEWAGKSPDIIEDQITYPLITSMVAVPKVKFVRGVSLLGVSYVYIIFKDSTDMYWARSRVIEYLGKITGQLPSGVSPTLGPDATGVSWIFQYALVDESGRHDLADLRSLQDWTLKYWLESVEGVAEVASLGGYVKQYQITVNPETLLAYNLPLKNIIDAVKRSNNDVGARVLELSGREYMIRGRGYIQSLEDIRDIPVGTDERGTPVFVRDVAHVALGPEIRRGLAELDGKGETVGGIIVMRFGENALKVISRVKEKLAEIRDSLPPGIEIVTTYDRSELIHKAIQTLNRTLIEEGIIVSLVCFIFLWHLRSSLVAILILPVAILLSFLPMHYLGISANIMSLGGIAIAIGAMIDGAIVMIENAHKELEISPGENRTQVIIRAAKQVGKPLFFSLLIITVSFIPVFTLEAQEGRLFQPLAFTKTFAMFFASLLSITLAPVLMVLLIRGKITPENKNPVNRFLVKWYRPCLHLGLKYKKATLVSAIVLVLVSLPLFSKLGSEFMPPLNEGTMLYMPTSLPGLSIREASRILHVQDKVIKTVPEVDHVFGKIGRAETSTDPAPLNMVETIITFKPREEWRSGLTWEKLTEELDRKLQIPGMPNIWWMPIQTRTEMLATGIRSALGIKILGPDLQVIEKLGIEMEPILKKIKGTRSVFAERVVGGYYIDFVIDRKEAARYGLTVQDVEDVIETAVGGKNITLTIEGRERYPVNLRYNREYRENLENIGRIMVPTPAGMQVPIGQVADIKIIQGPPSIRDENGSLAGFVFVDIKERDIGSYVEEAKKAVREQIKLPPGYRLVWAGQFQYMERAKEKLKLMIPFTLLIIFILLYMNFESISKTLIVFLSVPFSLVGSIWMLYLLDYNMSVAVWVGIIALAGVAAETGVIMLSYLDEAYERRKHSGQMQTLQDLQEAVIEGAGRRVRPIMMTVAAIIGGLLPIMWGHGTGSQVMQRIAAPMIGGMVSATILTLVVVPVLFILVKRWEGFPVK